MGAFDGMSNYFGQSRSSRAGVPRINSIPTRSGGERTAVGTDGKLFGISGSDWLGAGLSILGGFMGDRSDRRTARDNRRSTEQLSREQIMAERAGQRETLRANMQGDQDEYARTIMRNRAAIAPWGERYQGPRFTTATPNAPIYNPLMEEGHMFGQLGQPLAPPPDMRTPWNGG